MQKFQVSESQELGKCGGPVITAGGSLTVAHMPSKSDPITEPSGSTVHRELNFQVAASKSFSDIPPTWRGGGRSGEGTKEPLQIQEGNSILIPSA